MRKFILFLLLIAGWAVIFLLLLLPNLGLLGLPSAAAHPSSRPLPAPWSDADRLQVRIPGQPTLAAPGLSAAPAVQAAVASQATCGSRYILSPGQTLGQVAQDCGLSLAELLAANPQVTNPNRVFSGQSLSIPNPLVGRGGADPLAVIEAPIPPTGSYLPGAQLEIAAQGLPPHTRVRIGVGLSASGYRQLAEQVTGADGRITAVVHLPPDAQFGESGFFMLTSASVPVVQKISAAFTIGQ